MTGKEGESKFWWNHVRQNQSPILVESVEPKYAVVAAFEFEGRDDADAIARAKALVVELEAGRADAYELSKSVPTEYRWRIPR